MKNIKVNIINSKGKKSSTTLNFAICEQFYLSSPLFDHAKFEGDKVFSMSAYRRDITFCAQNFVNECIASQNAIGSVGVSQSPLESAMLMKVIYFNQ